MSVLNWITIILSLVALGMSLLTIHNNRRTRRLIAETERSRQLRENLPTSNTG
jgi:hypothetical protein